MSLTDLETGLDIIYGEPLFVGARGDIKCMSALSQSTVDRITLEERIPKPSEGRFGIDIHQASAGRNFNGSYSWLVDFKQGPFLFSVSQETAEKYLPTMVKQFSQPDLRCEFVKPELPVESVGVVLSFTGPSFTYLKNRIVDLLKADYNAWFPVKPEFKDHKALRYTPSSAAKDTILEITGLEYGIDYEVVDVDTGNPYDVEINIKFLSLKTDQASANVASWVEPN